MSRRFAFAVFFAAALAGAVVLASGPSSRVAWTLETVKLARGGDAGNVDIPDVPDLGGQEPLYIYKQLSDYKSGTRASSIMNESVKTLSDRDMADLAAFYAAQKRTPSPAKPAPPTEATVRLASIGDGVRLIPACDACHGDRGAGNPAFYGMPALEGQKLQDLTVQLLAFRSGERGNDVYRVMRDVCKPLTDAEITALASYYSGAPPDKSLVGKAPQK